MNDNYAVSLKWYRMDGMMRERAYPSKTLFFSSFDLSIKGDRDEINLFH